MRAVIHRAPAGVAAMAVRPLTTGGFGIAPVALGDITDGLGLGDVTNGLSGTVSDVVQTVGPIGSSGTLQDIVNTSSLIDGLRQQSR